MATTEKVLWKNWADALRQEMMSGLRKQVTKTVEELIAETKTAKAEKTLRSERFWLACQACEAPNDYLTRSGFDLEFQQDAKKQVQAVTFTLDRSWSNILQRVLDREALKQSVSSPSQKSTTSAKAAAKGKSYAN